VKVRVDYTVTVSDDYRRAIRMHFGRPGLASRDEVKSWLRSYGESGDDDLMYDLQQAIERGDEG